MPKLQVASTIIIVYYLVHVIGETIGNILAPFASHWFGDI